MARVRPGSVQAHIPQEEPRIRHSGDQVWSELPGPELVLERGREALSTMPSGKEVRGRHSKIISILSSKPFWSSEWRLETQQAEWQVEVNSQITVLQNDTSVEIFFFLTESCFWSLETGGREYKWWKPLLCSRIRQGGKFFETHNLCLSPVALPIY